LVTTTTTTPAFPATAAALETLRFHSGKVLVDGEVRDPLSARTLDQVFPGTGGVVAKVAACDGRDVDAAVVAAQTALEGGWRTLNARDRRRLLLGYARLLLEHAEELARLQTLDSGMPMQMSAGDVIGSPTAADYFEFYAGCVDKPIGEVLPVYGNAFDYTLREPLGVVACITAWNAPVYLYAAKVAPALACGNTVIVKPSEIGATATLRLAELALEAGIPKGVINVITGTGADCGEPLVTHDGIDAVSFTGGTSTGRHIAALTGARLKPTVLELGGKSANIVFEDGDIGLGAMLSAGMVAYGLSGQGCACATRALVQRSRLDEFTKTAVDTMAFMAPGDPFDPATMAGPLVSARQLDRVVGIVQRGVEEGVEVNCGGNRLGGDLAGGFFMEPTVLSTTNDSTPAREEIFGPVLSIIPFDDEEEAIRLANDTPYGLAGVVTTNDLKRAYRVAARLRTGTLGINSYSVQATTPFGGVKQSGRGREGSMQALDDYSSRKNVYVELG
jgi:aldehyde dehydrogenase (NAD+)